MSCGGAGGACGGGGFGGGGYAGAGGGNGPVRKVKVVKDEHGGEKWVIVENHGTIHENITQPDPNRQALVGVATEGRLGGIRYTYGDELPKKITQATVCAVICSILATPLVLHDLYHSNDTKAQEGMPYSRVDAMFKRQLARV